MLTTVFRGVDASLPVPPLRKPRHKEVGHSAALLTWQNLEVAEQGIPERQHMAFWLPVALSSRPGILDPPQSLPSETITLRYFPKSSTERPLLTSGLNFFTPKVFLNTYCALGTRNGATVNKKKQQKKSLTPWGGYSKNRETDKKQVRHCIL